MRPFPLHTGLAEVTAVEHVTPAMARITIKHEAFADPGVEQPGEILTLGWPMADEALELPVDGWRFPGGAKQHWRNFTVRGTDPAASTLDIDFFLHGDAGIAARWGLQASVGQTLGFAGPRTHWEPDPEATWSFVAADETGLPALLAILESLPAGHRAIAVAEVAGPDEEQAIDTEADVQLVWAHRGDAEPGTSSVLIDAIRDLDLPQDRGQAWGGGEAMAMRAMREHLVEHAPGASQSMRALGYWRHRTTPEDVV